MSDNDKRSIVIYETPYNLKQLKEKLKQLGISFNVSREEFYEYNKHFKYYKDIFYLTNLIFDTEEELNFFLLNDFIDCKDQVYVSYCENAVDRWWLKKR